MKKYVSIQYLRAIAALMVIFHHSRNPIVGLYDPLAGFGAGQAGVDVFFVISGFIMYSAARSEYPVEFLRRRAIRVAPMYWIATLLTFIFATHFLKEHFSLDHLLKSLLFIPHYNPNYPKEIWPYLILGWTLNFEVFFYAIFAVGLATKRLIQVLTLAIVMLVILGMLVKSDNPLWLTYTNPLLLEFFSGVLIAKWSERNISWCWSLLLPIGVLAIGLSTYSSGPRVLCWGVPAAMMVIGAIALERTNNLPNWNFLGALGDASYSIYLFQVIAIGRVAVIVHKVPLKGPLQLFAMIGLSITAATALGLIAHYLLEKPVTRLLGNRKLKSKLSHVEAGTSLD